MFRLEPSRCRTEILETFRLLGMAEVALVRVIGAWSGAWALIVAFDDVLNMCFRYILNSWFEFLVISSLVKHSILFVSWHLRNKKT